MTVAGCRPTITSEMLVIVTGTVFGLDMVMVPFTA